MPSSDSIPLRSFDGFLKRVRLNENEALASCIIDLACPHFRGFDQADPRRSRLLATFYGSERLSKLAEQNPRRRFSGHDSPGLALPRGRYYSVCRPRLMTDAQLGKIPADNGVIANELRAYTNHLAAGPVWFLDRQRELERQLLEGWSPSIDGERTKAFGVVFLRKPGERNVADLFLSELERDPASFSGDFWGGGFATIRFGGNPFPFLADIDATIDMINVFNVYYDIEAVRINRVVDLRFAETQRAFVHTFCPHLAQQHPEAGDVGGFVAMLPHLLNPSLGGSIETDVVGTYLRAIGAEALIYPSSRNDASVHFQDDEMIDFDGWNLVDYRGAAVPDLPSLPPALFPPLSRLPFRIHVPHPEEKPVRGSWRIEGLAKQVRDNYEVAVREYFVKST